MKIPHLAVPAASLMFSLLILSGAGCTGSPGAPTPSDGPAASSTAAELEAGGLIDSPVVSIGPSRMNPASITLKIGQSVTWINEDAGSAHRIVSVPTVDKNAYPGFESGETIPPGGTWGFRFDQAGTWDYHDEVDPALRGTAIVTE